jgi:hypothetical protein
MHPVGFERQNRLREALVSILFRLMKTESLGTYHRYSSPYRGNIERTISGEYKADTWKDTARMTADQADALEALVSEVLPELAANALARGKQAGASILRKLTKGEINATTFQLETESK